MHARHALAGRRLARCALALSLLALAGPAPGAGGVRVAGPVVQLDPETIDFGTLAQGEQPQHDVQLHNRGSAPLLIGEVTSNCGCTVAQLPDSVLAPGATTQMRVTLQTLSFSGDVVKQITLHTNDPGAPQATITLKAHVRPRLDVRPTQVDFGSVPVGESPVRTVTLKAARRDSLVVDSLLFPADYVRARLEQATIADSVVIQLHLELRPDAPAGPFRETGRIITNQTTAPRVPIHLRGQVRGFFTVSPPALSYGLVRSDRGKSQKAVLTGAGDGHHRVTGADCPHPDVACQVVTVEEGRRYEVRVTLQPGIAAGMLQTEVVISTDDPAQPQIPLELRGSVRAVPGQGGS